jgi:hypothetical protein
MSKLAAIAGAAGIVAALAAVLVVPEVREYACTNSGRLCALQEVVVKRSEPTADALHERLRREAESTMLAARVLREAESERRTQEERLADTRRNLAEVEATRKVEEDALARRLAERSRQQNEPPKAGASPHTTATQTEASDLLHYDRIVDHSAAVGVNPTDLIQMRNSGTSEVVTLHANPNAPAYLERRVSLGGGGASLLFAIRGHPRGDFLARVVVAPQVGEQQVIYEKVIVGQRGWYKESLSLAQFKDQTITIRLESHANGWYFEHAAIDYFYVQQQ